MILVSSCLFNNPVRYSGDGNPCPLIIKYKECGHFIPICPECAGGLPTPRPPSEIVGGNGADVWAGRAQVVNNLSQDVTANFTSGALAYLHYLQEMPITAAILKERSPSCGSHVIYDGSFQGKRIPGQGVVAALLQQHQVPLYSEEELSEALLLRLIAQDEAATK